MEFFSKIRGQISRSLVGRDQRFLKGSSDYKLEVKGEEER